MAIKLSNSGINDYLSCARKYKVSRIDGIKAVTISSPLIYGGAIDIGLNYMLEHKDDADVLEKSIHEFDRAFEQGKNSVGEIVDMPLNPNIQYSKTDFDSDLLNKADWRELFGYDPKFFETKVEVDNLISPKEDEDGNKAEPIPWLSIPEEKRSVLNYATWKCMSKKGHLHIEAYYNDILPKIKKVVKVQGNLSLLDEDGNDLNGVLDAIVEIDGEDFGLEKGRKTIVLDNKTSSQRYENNSVATSSQLAKYKATLNIQASDPEDPWNTPIDYCGYAVLVKKLKKDKKKVCKECGHIGLGSHKTCDNIIEGTRCNGEWDKTVTFKVDTQFIVDTISDNIVEDSLETAVSVRKAIEYGLFPKNQNACQNMFGRPCEYINYCVNGDMHGLIKKEKKSE